MEGEKGRRKEGKKQESEATGRKDGGSKQGRKEIGREQGRRRERGRQEPRKEETDKWKEGNEEGWHKKLTNLVVYCPVDGLLKQPILPSNLRYLKSHCTLSSFVD